MTGGADGTDRDEPRGGRSPNVGASRRGPSTRGRSPTRSRARWCRRSACRRRSPSRASGATGGSSTRAAPTRPAPRSSPASPRSRAPATGSPSPRASPPRTPCSASSGRGPGWCWAATPTAARSGSSTRCTALAGHPWHAVDLTDPAGLARAWPEGTAMVWAETPTNPAMAVVDIAAVAEVAHDHGALLVVDNTFATPYLQQPLALGADVVVHSSTKYLGGHSDVVGGFVALNDDDLAVRARVHPERGRWRPLALRLLPGAPRGQDPGRAHGPPLRQRPRRRRGPGRPPGRRAGAVAGSARAPRPRRGQAADARLRGHGVVRGAGRRGCGRGVLRAHRGVHAGRVAGCGRVAGRASGPHDPCVGRRFAARGRPRAWCACRSASSRCPTWSPTSARRSATSPDTIACRAGRRRPVRCRPDGGAPRPVRLPASPGGHGGHHRGLRRRPPGPPGGRRRGAPAGGRARGLATRRRHLRPAPGVGRPARVRAPPAHRPRPEARAAGRDRGRLLPGHHVRRGPQPGAGRGLRPRGPGRVPRRPGRRGGRRLPLRPRPGRATSPCCASMGAELGFEVEGLDLVGADGRPAGDADRVSSTRIRHALAEGDLALGQRAARPAATRCGASWPAATSGARELGFPTANVSVPGDVLLPADGIYAGWYERPDGSVHPTAISLGRRPTFYAEAHASLLEAHLLDFSGDLYDEHAKVRFVAWLRGEAQVRLGRRADRADRPRLRRGPPHPRRVRHRVVTLTERGRVPVRAYRVSHRRYGRRRHPRADRGAGRTERRRTGVVPGRRHPAAAPAVAAPRARRIRRAPRRPPPGRGAARRPRRPDRGSRPTPPRPTSSWPCPGSPATRSCSTTTTGSGWRCAAGGCPSCWSTGSPPRASSTPRRCPAWSAWGSRWWPSTWPATAAPRACPPAATTSSPTRSCWPGCSTSSASAGPCSPATRWAGGS